MTEDREGSLTVAETAVGERLDRFLALQLDVPRSQIQRWVRAGLVLIDGSAARGSHSLRLGEQIRWSAVPAPLETLIPEPGPLSVLYQDDDLLVVDKPAGLTVHPGAGRDTGTLANRVLAEYPQVAGVGGPGRPGIVHRLDRDTSGVMAIALSPASYRSLSNAFAERRVDKRYQAVLYGPFTASKWTVDAPIGRHPTERTKMTVRPDGRSAVTHFEILEQAGRLAHVAIQIETGRTHQIRVHAKHVGTPLVGDPVYGEARWKGFLPRFRPPLEQLALPSEKTTP